MANPPSSSNDAQNAQLAALESELAKQSQSASEDNKEQPEAKSAATKAAAPERRNTGVWAFSLFNFLLILGVAGAGVWGYWQWQQQSNERAALLSEQQNLQVQLQQQRANASELEQATQQMQSAFEQLKQQLAATEFEIQANRERLGDISGRRPSDWLLAEADYLVRMAGRKMWLEHDVRTAILMLESADSRLQDLADPSLIPIRELVIEDIQTLQQVNPVSLSSVAMSLTGLTKQVSALPLAMPELPEIEEVVDDVELTNSIWDAGENLKRMWRWFSRDFADIRPRNIAMKPLLSEQQQWLLREQLKYVLLQGQSAVMQENAGLFEESLALATTLLMQNYDLESVQVKQFADSLHTLQQLDVVRKYPAQLAAMQPLKDLLEARLSNLYLNKTPSDKNNEVNE